MQYFKAGDKVRRIAGEHKRMVVGDVAMVTTSEIDGVRLKGFRYLHDPDNFELVEGEKETMSKWLKEHAWYIETGNFGKSKLVQEWLFEHDMEWLSGKTVQSDLNDQLLTNTNCAGTKEKHIMYSTNNNKNNAQEIKVEFETVVKSVTLPTVPVKSEQEIKIEELEAAITKAYEQIKQLKGEK